MPRERKENGLGRGNTTYSGITKVGGSRKQEVGDIRVLMHKSRFNKKVRIDSKQLNWLRENKDTKTIAGFLDSIIDGLRKESSIRWIRYGDGYVFKIAVRQLRQEEGMNIIYDKAKHSYFVESEVTK